MVLGCYDRFTGSFAEDMQRENPRRWEAKRGELGIDDLQLNMRRSSRFGDGVVKLWKALTNLGGR